MTIESKYIVSIEREDLIVTEVYDTLEEANGCASREWDHLSEHDKKSQSISVLYVEKTEKYFMPDDLANDPFEWSAWTNADAPPGAVKY